jgi:hypothetical protein
MRKLLLGMLMIAFGFTANAQGDFNVGINAGLPIGDVSDSYTFALGLEVNYLFEVSDDFQVGPSVSYASYFGDSVELLGTSFDVDNASFLPIAAAARFNASEDFVLGADLGYALGLAPDGNDGGFYYRPMVGYNLGENFMLQATYSGVSVDGGSFGNVGLGGVFKL